MLIQWLGHSSFLIVAGDGKKIVTDPYTPNAYPGTLNYGPITVSPDIVTTSHKHADHNGVDQLSNHFAIIAKPGEHDACGIKINGVPAFHDLEQGAVRGEDIVFNMEIDGIHVCHLGDLGDVLTDQQIEQIGPVDVLLIPVGGYYTIGPEQADRVIAQLKPKIAIPMHFKTDKCEFPIQPVADFLKGKTNVRIMETLELEVAKDHLPSETQIIVLQHAL